VAAVDFFLKLDSIDGESLDAKHKGEIELDSFSFGATQTGTFASGGGGGAGKVQFQELHFVATTSKASPKLLQACANGRHIIKGMIVARKAGGEQQEFLKITLQDVLISSYSLNGDKIVGPVDSSGMAFAKIEYSFAPQDATGKLLPAVNVGWDLKANKAV
jgi:type VI secretion system secreted protein Hcp